MASSSAWSASCTLLFAPFLTTQKLLAEGYVGHAGSGGREDGTWHNIVREQAAQTEITSSRVVNGPRARTRHLKAHSYRVFQHFKRKRHLKVLQLSCRVVNARGRHLQALGSGVVKRLSRARHLKALGIPHPYHVDHRKQMREVQFSVGCGEGQQGKTHGVCPRVGVLDAVKGRTDYSRLG
ncbi:hypothetical protein B0H14DRAFT_2597293 [Mycena olivaceomarginata]|nr:hypothetical protein B0H14DRAFT_2597293 [Mycena olivaceomarginata]